MWSRVEVAVVSVCVRSLRPLAVAGLTGLAMALLAWAAVAGATDGLLREAKRAREAGRHREALALYMAIARDHPGAPACAIALDGIETLEPFVSQWETLYGFYSEILSERALDRYKARKAANGFLRAHRGRDMALRDAETQLERHAASAVAAHREGVQDALVIFRGASWPALEGIKDQINRHGEWLRSEEGTQPIRVSAQAVSDGHPWTRGASQSSALRDERRTNVYAFYVDLMLFRWATEHDESAALKRIEAVLSDPVCVGHVPLGEALEFCQAIRAGDRVVSPLVRAELQTVFGQSHYMNPLDPMRLKFIATRPTVAREVCEHFVKSAQTEKASLGQLAVAAEFLADTEQYGRAFGLYERIGTEYPELRTWAALQRARVLAVRKGELDEAEDVCKRIQSGGGTNSYDRDMVALMESMISYLRRDYKKSAESCRNLLSSRGLDARLALEAKILLSLSLLSGGELKAGLDVLEDESLVRSGDPLEVHVHYLRGLFLREVGEYAKAAKSLARLAQTPLGESFQVAAFGLLSSLPLQILKDRTDSSELRLLTPERSKVSPK